MLGIVCHKQNMSQQNTVITIQRQKGSSEMAQWVKLLAAKTDDLFDSQGPHGRRRG